MNTNGFLLEGCRERERRDDGSSLSGGRVSDVNGSSRELQRRDGGHGIVDFDGAHGLREESIDEKGVRVE